MIPDRNLDNISAAETTYTYLPTDRISSQHGSIGVVHAISPRRQAGNPHSKHHHNLPLGRKNPSFKWTRDETEQRCPVSKPPAHQDIRTDEVISNYISTTGVLWRRH